MYSRNDTDQLTMEEFFQPFGGRQRKDNRWVRLADIMPWEYIEMIYRVSLSEETGRPAISPRIAFGAIFIKDSCRCNAIEGRIGNAKRRFGLGRIFSKLDETAKTEAALILLVMNASLRLVRWLARFSTSACSFPERRVFQQTLNYNFFKNTCIIHLNHV